MVSEVLSIWKLSHGMAKPTKWSVRPAKTQIRLGGCPGWSESSLGTKVILLVLSWGGSKCFFLESKYAAHTHFITFCFTFRIEPNMKLLNHANNIVLRRDIYIHILSKSSNRPLNFLSIFFDAINNLTILLASPNRRICQLSMPLNGLA